VIAEAQEAWKLLMDTASVVDMDLDQVAVMYPLFGKETGRRIFTFMCQVGQLH